METETTIRDHMTPAEAPLEGPREESLAEWRDRRWEERNLERKRQNRQLILIAVEAAYNLCMEAAPGSCADLAQALVRMQEEDFCSYHTEGSR